MSEALHHTPGSEAPKGQVIPIQREADTSEQDFSQLPSREVVDIFIQMTGHHPAYRPRKGAALAEVIHHDLSTPPTKNTTLGGRLAQIESEISSVWTFADTYDHKDAHDAVFHSLADILQSTKNNKDLMLQRRVALKLLNLRATIKDDKTDIDDDWRSIIQRLFG